MIHARIDVRRAIHELHEAALSTLRLNTVSGSPPSGLATSTGV